MKTFLRAGALSLLLAAGAAPTALAQAAAARRRHHVPRHHAEPRRLWGDQGRARHGHASAWAS